MPALSDQALFGALHTRNRFRRLYRACARGQWISFRAQPVGAEGSWRAKWTRPRPRSTLNGPRFIATACRRSRRSSRIRGSIRARSEEADVFAVHQAGGYSCVEVFFFRTGQNWGNRAYFPKADRALWSGRSAWRIPRAILRRQAAAALHSRCRTISRSAHCLPKALTSKNRAQSRS